ncbi:polyketide cyclase [Mycobacterium sp. CBMA 234]|uniref:polyketide cyclase n=1 Tax=Mycolicibacterium sp. CBMA 234 TaxID=1918495 RepID=UPI0012DC802C|nr:polyketide cyclase [Mycolicibacterium sp. CBMA 234]MUL63843.1 polyketide cyclase [Mycolicibacterium sp. CBMA 234]
MIGDRWGVTDAETRAEYGCDRYVAGPALEAWRGVTVNTTPERVWPWLIQVRLAPYSYDWIDNFGRRSPRELCNLPDPEPGDPFSASAGRPLGRILSVDHQVQLTAQIIGAYMSYRLIPTDDRTTRLVLKVAAPQSLRFVAPLLSLGDLVMARRQLLNLKHHAES